MALRLTALSSSRFFLAAGTGALLVLIVILLTGGFALPIGPVRVSARSWPTPLIVAMLGWALGWRAAAWLADVVQRRAALIAAVVASTCAATAIAYGTFAAAGADAAGYVSQAHLVAAGTLVREVPLAARIGWPDAAWTFSPLGYRPGVEPEMLVPTYPPGLPLLMAPTLVASELGPYFVAPMLAAVAVLCTYAIGARLHSRIAGLVAAVLLATSPIVLFQAVQPMSDVPVTALWALSLVLALTPARHAPLAAGAAAGVAILTRPNLLPFVVVPLLARPPLLPFLAPAARDPRRRAARGPYRRGRRECRGGTPGAGVQPAPLRGAVP